MQTVQEKIEQAEKLGKAAFTDGHSLAPAANPEIMKMIEGNEVGNKDTILIIKAYRDAWVAGSLAETSGD